MVPRVLAAVLLAVSSTGIALGSLEPTKAVRVVVPFAPGGMTDVLARILTQKLGSLWRKPVFVENRAGANSIIGTESVVRAVPDGQTLLIANSTLVLNQSLLSRLPFDAARDLVPVARVLESPLVIVVSNDNRFRSLSDLAAQARSQTVSIASTGTGSISHLGAALFGVHTRARFEYIPYRGGAPAVSDLMNGRAHAMFIEVAPVLSFIREGRLRALAVTSEKRVALLREVPTVAESGIRGYQAVQWYGVFAPTGTKRELTQKIARDLERVLMETAEEFHRFGQQASFLPPDRFAEFIKDELRTWSRVVKEKNIKLD